MPRRAFLFAAFLAVSMWLAVYQPNALTALATAVLTGFAALQISADRVKRRSEERTADARLSVNGFALRKTLADWIVQSQKVGWSDHPSKHAQDAVVFAEGLRDRLEQGLVDAAGASPTAAGHMRTAYAYWQRAEILFDEYLSDHHRETIARIQASQYDPATGTVKATGSVTPADANRLSDARESLRACYLALEPVVDRALMAEAKRLGAGPSV